MTSTSDGYVIRHVVVTQDHIDRGARNSVTSCPVSLALDDVRVHVWGGDVCLSRDGTHQGEHFGVTLPGEVAAWINDFDDGLPVHPFEFDIDWPAEGPVTNGEYTRFGASY